MDEGNELTRIGANERDDTRKSAYDDHSRTIANDRETTRTDEPEDFSRYKISIPETADIFAAAGFPFGIRTIQNYCDRRALKCKKLDTVAGKRSFPFIR
jgi:antitoxin component HigA of HigAB toxin-antitoxin module